ncbi:Protein of unknown function [Geodermatophilus siccatus]|uniref:DUF3500 domain-containing protein n=1 Tax=Geodermatophilus siccatus TaxID=1137991 RepID=A0A1G9QK95_9ACTN|nr:DUF3500 domain-containing protein [Geodermatophilus siccatus]SDM11444.1 Protein of unknown function [Geodermatophilus siccatus]
MNSRVSTTSIAASAAVLLSLGLVGCRSDDSSDSSSSSSASASSSGSSTSTPGSGDVVALAEAFVATLDEDQAEALQQDYTFENATNWSNFPNALLTGDFGFPGGGAPSGGPPSGGPPTGGGAGSTGSTGRVGLQTDSLTDQQWSALEDLLAGVTGSAANEGFDEILQHLAADDYLTDNGGGDDYGRGDYFIAFLGEPSDSGTWELQFGGHHLAVANTYVDGALAGATPSFRGIEPFETVEQDGETVQPEQQEQAAFAALLASLSEEQLSTARLSETYGDILLGPGNDWAFPETSEGLVGSELDDEQKALLLAAIATYVGDVDDANAESILAGYESELDDTYVAFSGNSSISEVGDYIRIDGPSVWIEFSLQNGIVLEGAHPHAVWRDKQSDYAGLTS